MLTDPSVRISRMISSHVNREMIGDDMETAILNGNSSIIIDYEHQKEEELAFCNRMACFLNRSTDLPLVCRNKFPSVVEAVDHKAASEVDDALLHRPIHHQSSLLPLVNGGAVAAGYNSSNIGISTMMYPMPPPSDR